MDPNLKKILKSLSLELRHLLEGWYDNHEAWHPGDLERRLNELGVWRDRAKPFDEVKERLGPVDREARKVVDAYLTLRDEAGVRQTEAVAEFVRESAYTWANRLLALRCMEAQGIIDEVILQKEAYGGRSLVHNRFARNNPAACTGDDDGLLDVLTQEFAQRANELPAVFDPAAPAVVLRPSVAALKRAVALLSGRQSMHAQEAATDAVFEAPDALGWAYQYWNVEEKDRVFTKVRTQRAKIEGADIIPATQLYTELYMVKFLVQNSLGATWMGMHPDSRLAEGWEYYVRDADRTPSQTKPVGEITLLDPAVGSGHFLLEAFDLFWGMHEEEGATATPESIAAAIFNNNLFGIDIDERAAQIAQAALWMKAKERAPNLTADAIAGFRDHLVACNIRLPRAEDHVRVFLEKHPEDTPIRRVLPAIFEGLAHANELGSLLKVEEIIEAEIAEMRRADPLFAYSMAAEGWGGRIMDRLREHFAAEARQADLVQAFFSRAASNGLALLGLLARRYDVVTANPPYMGSRNLGTEIRGYLELHYGPGKSDLYAAFIVRNLQLAAETGRVAMVTQQSWMFLRSFADLRAKDQPFAGFGGLLRDTTIETLAHLGARAFGEISGEVVNVALFIFARAAPADEHRLTAFRLVGSPTPEENDSLLRKAVAMADESIVSQPLQARFLTVPQAPICYWLRDRFFELLAGPKLNDVAEVLQGLATANDARFVRYVWEVSPSDWRQSVHQRRWVPFEKGGGYGKWFGHHFWTVDWEQCGARLKTVTTERYGNFGKRIFNENQFFKRGLTYSVTGLGSVGFRTLSNAAFSAQGAGVIYDDNVIIAPIANCRLTTALVRAMTAQMYLRESYVARIPFTTKLGPDIKAVETACIELKKWVVARNLREQSFDHTAVSFDQIEAVTASLHASEGTSETRVFDAFGIEGDDLESTLEETGTPAAWNELIARYDGTPILPDSLLRITFDVAPEQTRNEYSTNKLAALKRRLRFLYEAGPGASDDGGESFSISEDEDEEAEQIATVGGRIPIPAETFVEELSNKLEIHPISIYWLLKEGREKEGWRCLPEEKRLIEDRMCVLVLRLLGHRWPRQVEAGEAVPDWGDRDGVIPLTPGCGEPTLADWLNERLEGEFPASTVAAVKRQFAEVVGQPVDEWLSGPFFTEHVSQFRKRPIAWLVQTRAQIPAGGGRRPRGTPQTRPAFACLVYYHKLDADLFPKLRTQYVGPLRARFETELRTLEAIASPTAEQSTRRVELGNRIEELKSFDDQLSDVITSGFGPDPLLSRIRSAAIAEAVLVLKAAWLRKLGTEIQSGPMEGWTLRAKKTELHPDLSAWIVRSIDRIETYCSQVGPAPDSQLLWDAEPDARQVADFITKDTASLVKDTLRCLCDAWWAEFDLGVVQPLRSQITELNQSIKKVEAELEVNAGLDPKEARRCKEEIKRLRARIKEFKDKQRRCVQLAQGIRQEIEAWSCPAADSWRTWLASQPLYDHLSSLDGLRPPPSDIAGFVAQERGYAPDLNDGVRVNIAPLQRHGLLAADVLASTDLNKAATDRVDWRADERRWCREGKLPHPGWWAERTGGSSA